MVDPIASQAQFITQQALSSGLSVLLRQGPQQGTVVSQQPGGKTTFVFNGRTFTLEAQSANLKPGDPVLAKLEEGRFVLEVMARSSDPAASPSSAAAPRSIGTVLANMGLSGQNVQMLAQALIQAGIPLDRSALKELAQILPQLSGNQLTALTFVLSRGMPVNPAILAMVVQLFTLKPRIADTANSTLTKLKDLDKKLSKDEEDESDPVLDASQRRKLREAHEAVERAIPRPRNDANSEDADPDKALENLLRSALASPEALIQKNGLGHIQSLGEAVVQLLTLLMELKPLFANSIYAQLFASLFQDVKTLHETLTAQALKNLPPQSGDGFTPIFIQIPIRSDEKNRQLELRYSPKGKNKKTGNLDFLVDLSNLGPIHIAIQWEHPRITISLTTSDPAARDFIQPLLDELNELLRQKGFLVQSLGVAVGEIPETLKPEEATAAGALNGVDIRA